MFDLGKIHKADLHIVACDVDERRIKKLAVIPSPVPGFEALDYRMYGWKDDRAYLSVPDVKATEHGRGGLERVYYSIDWDGNREELPGLPRAVENIEHPGNGYLVQRFEDPRYGGSDVREGDPYLIYRWMYVNNDHVIAVATDRAKEWQWLLVVRRGEWSVESLN